jgi:hypothetical protein
VAPRYRLPLYKNVAALIISSCISWYSFWKMVMGIWTLKCQECAQSFEVTLKGDFETVIDTVMSKACPGCKKVPIKRPVTAWHHIIGFRDPSKTPR